MRLYEFKNGDGTIDVVVTTDGIRDQKRVFVTATPSGIGYKTPGSIPEGTGAILALGFNFTNGVEYEHGDFINFADRNGLQLQQWDQGLGGVVTELVPLGGLHVYTLTVPQALSFVKAGEAKTLAITSTKQKLVDGAPSGPVMQVSTVNTIAGEGFSIDSAFLVTATQNAGSTERIGTITVTQNESGKKATVKLTQAGA